MLKINPSVGQKNIITISELKILYIFHEGDGNNKNKIFDCFPTRIGILNINASMFMQSSEIAFSEDLMPNFT